MNQCGFSPSEHFPGDSCLSVWTLGNAAVIRGGREAPTVRIRLREKLHFHKTEMSSGKISSLFEEFANPQRAFASQG